MHTHWFRVEEAAAVVRQSGRLSTEPPREQPTASARCMTEPRPERRRESRATGGGEPHAAVDERDGLAARGTRCTPPPFSSALAITR